jgi:peroxiredoxin/predicted small lipoprotein YifL
MRTHLKIIVAAALVLALAACKPAGPVSSRAAAPAAASSASDPAELSQANALFAHAGFDIPATEIKATDFTLESLEGKKVSLSSFKGKTVVLSFWATWCVPCQQEMPAMQALYESLRSKGFEIVAVDVMEEKTTVAKFRKDHGYTFPMLLDSKGEVGGIYGVQGIPTNFVIGPEGRVLARVVGVGGPGWTSPEMKALFDHLLGP